MKERKTMEKTIEIDKNSPKDVRVGDMLYLHAAPDRAYAITRVDPEDGDLPYCIDAAEHMDETTRHVREILDGVACDDPSWASPILVSRITREVDVPDWPTPKHNNIAYRGVDGRLYLYMSSGGNDPNPWFYATPNGDFPMHWSSAEQLSTHHPEALPLMEIGPTYARPTARRITDIREVRIGFIVFAKGFSTPFVCAFRDNAQRDVSSAFYKDSLICVSGKLPDELSAICGGSLNYCWLRNDMFDYAIAPIDSLGLGGDHE